VCVCVCVCVCVARYSFVFSCTTLNPCDGIVLNACNGAEEDGWMFRKVEEGVLIDSKEESDSEIFLFRGRATIDADVHQLAHYVVGVDHMKEFDDLFVRGRLRRYSSSYDRPSCVTDSVRIVCCVAACVHASSSVRCVLCVWNVVTRVLCGLLFLFPPLSLSRTLSLIQSLLFLCCFTLHVTHLLLLLVAFLFCTL
jgi:hypothetical protein